MCIIEMEEREKINLPATVIEHRFFSENNDNEITATLFFQPVLVDGSEFFFLLLFCLFFLEGRGLAVRLYRKKMIKKKRLQNIKLCHFSCTWQLNQRGKLMRPAGPD